MSRKRMKVPAELRKLARQARRQGWTVEPTGSGHLRFRSPDGRPIYASSSPSDRRSTRNDKAALRRAGLDTTKGKR